MDKQNLSNKIIRNTIFNIFGRFWIILVTLFLTPYIIRHIGLERFGIWALVGVLTGYFGLLDFGFGQSFIKYISEFYTKKDYKKINQIINSGFIFYFVFAIIIIALAFFAVKPIINLLKIPTYLHNESLFVFLLGIIIFGVSSIMSPFTAIQGGLQRMDITNKVTISLSIPMIAGTVFFLERGYGLPGLMINNAIILLLTSIINFAIAFRILPQLRLNPFLLNWEMIKQLFRYGLKLQIIQFEGIFTFQTDKLLISYFLNIGLVSFYQLGSMIINKTRSLPLLLISAIVPAASELDARQDKKRIYDLYFRGTKYLAVVGMPLLVLVSLTASLVMLVWMGQGFEKSVLVIQILAPCYLINFLTGMGTSIALGIGKPEFHMKAAIFQFILNLILSIILIIKIGFMGVVIATLIALSLSSMWFVIMFHRHMQYPLLEFVQMIVVKPIIACLPPALIIGVTNYLISFSSNRLSNFSILILEIAIFIALYILVILKIRYLDDYDLRVFKKNFYFLTYPVKLFRRDK